MVEEAASGVPLCGMGTDVIIPSHGHHHTDQILQLQAVVAVANEYLKCVGALILIIAVILGFVNVMLSIFNDTFSKSIKSVFPTHGRRQPASIKRTRVELGSLVALGLEILVVTDVLETLTSDISAYSFEKLAKIGIIALFRTFLAFCLGKEIKEIKEEMEDSRRKLRLRHEYEHDQGRDQADEPRRLDDQSIRDTRDSQSESNVVPACALEDGGTERNLNRRSRRMIK
jgi:uncharacterized membrane protein